MQQNTGLRVINDDRNLIYSVYLNNTVLKGRDSYNEYGLHLDQGWDYVNPDENDVQGWVDAEMFVEDVQYESVIQYFVVESLEEALEEAGFSIYTK